MKIQLTKTKAIDWTPPWERKARVLTDVVGIDMGAGDSRGYPAVRVRKQRRGYALASVGFIPPPEGSLPTSWDELGDQPKWTLPPAFRADSAALAVSSPDVFTRQTAAAPFAESAETEPPNQALSKNGFRTCYGKMSDELSVIHVGLPEYQALWLSRLLPEGRRPTATSVQTTTAALLASLNNQPDFCESTEEVALFVTEETITIASYRNGMPLLFRECPGAVGARAMRDAVRTALGIDASMLDTVFSSNGIIDTRPALDPILAPVLSQIEITIDYLKGRLGANLNRIFVMGDPAGCEMLRRVLASRLTIQTISPNAFTGFELPLKNVAWKSEFATGEKSHPFLTALGAALAALEGASS